MDNNKITNFLKSNYYKLLFVLGIIAYLGTLLLAAWYARPLHLLYVLLVSIFLALLIIQLFYEAGLKVIDLNLDSTILLLILIYILLLFWYGFVKVYPDYKYIIEFRKKRSDLIYNIQKNAPPIESYLAYKRQLAELYLNANSAVDKLEPHVKHHGVTLMLAFLDEQIRNGKGSEYGRYMYDLAEVAFTVASRDLAKEWYEKAQKYGIANAMDRYQKRMDDFNKESNR